MVASELFVDRLMTEERSITVEQVFDVSVGILPFHSCRKFSLCMNRHKRDARIGRSQVYSSNESCTSNALILCSRFR